MTSLDRSHVEEAIDLVDSGGRVGAPLRGAAWERRLDSLVQYIISEFPADTVGLRVSRDEIDRRVRDLLDEASEENSPVDAFEAGFEQLPGDIQDVPLERYAIGFPLNVSPQIPFDELVFGDHRFELMDREEWMDEFGDHSLDDDDFASQFEAVPNAFEDDYSYWVFEYTARDPKHVLEVADRDLGVVLGQLIYCLFPWSHSNQFDGETVWNRPWSELRHPFVYVLRDSDGYRDAYLDDDISPRRTVQMLRDRQDRLEMRYEQIPPLDDSEPIDQKIISAFSNFQSGATEADSRQAFLDYWRAIETLCLFGDQPMRNVVARAAAVIEEEPEDELLRRRLESAKNKRNALVHEQVGVTITRRDNEFLRSILYELLPFMFINHRWDPEKIEFWLDNASKTTVSLEDAVRERERQVETERRNLDVLRTILDSR